jgi:hypothetical protein
MNTILLLKGEVYMEKSKEDKLFESVDLKPLEKEASRLLGIPVKLDHIEKKDENRWEVAMKKNLVEHVGIFKSVIKEVYINSFNHWHLNVDKGILACNLHLSYIHHGGGSNGKEVFHAWYEFATKKWSFR